MRRGSRLAVAEVDDESVVYEVLLLAGSPRCSSVTLPADVGEGSVIEVDGEQWMVADLRPADGEPSRLICIYAV